MSAGRATIEEVRGDLAAKLRERRAEILQTAAARVYSIADPEEVDDPEYRVGIKAAVAEALDYAIAAVELGEDRLPPIPTALLSQARLAARNGVSLDTVFRRYLAGYTLFGDFVLQEVEPEFQRSGTTLHRLLQDQAVQFDQVLTAVSAEYRREAELVAPSRRSRRLRRVSRLLACKPTTTTDIDYDFSLWHLALIVEGEEPEATLRPLAQELDQRLLSVRPSEDTTWAWLGGRRSLEPADLIDRLPLDGDSEIAVSLGEPARDLEGWRLSHHQAKIARSAGRESGERLVRYSDIGLLASVRRDEVLSESLKRTYLDPLGSRRGGGETTCETLLTYLVVGRNATAAAATLGLSRQTVAARLQKAEEQIGRSLDACAAELELALRLRKHGHLE